MEEKKLQKIRFTHDGPIYDLTPDWENIELITTDDINEICNSVAITIKNENVPVSISISVIRESSTIMSFTLQEGSDHEITFNVLCNDTIYVSAGGWSTIAKASENITQLDNTNFLIPPFYDNIVGTIYIYDND